MTTLPINLALDQARAVIHGGCTVLHRAPGRRLQGLIAGDRLWIREPFHIERAWAHLSPSLAADQGKLFAFAADHTPDNPIRPDRWGPRLAGYTLPRAAHRAHLFVTAVAHLPLSEVPRAELAAQGFPTRGALLAQIVLARARFGSLYAADRRPTLPDRDPLVQAIAFKFVPTPLEETHRG